MAIAEIGKPKINFIISANRFITQLSAPRGTSCPPSAVASPAASLCLACGLAGDLQAGNPRPLRPTRSPKLYVPSRGIEPPLLVPKTSALSIELRRLKRARAKCSNPLSYGCMSVIINELDKEVKEGG